MLGPEKELGYPGDKAGKYEKYPAGQQTPSFLHACVHTRAHIPSGRTGPEQQQQMKESQSRAVAGDVGGRMPSQHPRMQDKNRA